MSCKVLASTVAAQPFFEVLLQRQDPPDVAAVEAAAPPAVPPEVAALHNRIVELERALQLDVKKAREGGFREGETAGRDRAASELQPVLTRLSASIAGLAALRSRIRADAEKELVELAMAVARRILRRELTVDPDAVGGLVRSALDKVQSRDVVRVRMHPDYIGPLTKCLAGYPAAAGVEIAPDGGLQPGDVIIETRRGDLDGSVETQLAEIERGFADRLGR
jgi:flagellar assembly protein FliH